MSLGVIRSGLVIFIPRQYKKEVLVFLNDKKDKPILCKEDESDFMLIFNEAEVTDVTTWLTQTIELLDYNNHMDFYKLSDDNLLILYTSARHKKDVFNIGLKSSHILTFWNLSLIIDWIYDTKFDTDQADKNPCTKAPPNYNPDFLANRAIALRDSLRSVSLRELRGVSRDMELLPSYVG